MENKEALYEISLKFNTLKMYENTIGQMKKNGRENSDSFKKIVSEKEEIEKEISDLLNHEKNDKSENLFLKAAKKADTSLRNVYKDNANFFDSVGKKVHHFERIPTLNEERERINNEMKGKKPILADIQEKISNAQWISTSNFIVKFPKDRLNIDEWRVSSFYYSFDKKMCRPAIENIGGQINVVVNDFSFMDEDGNHVILSNMIEELYRKPYTHSIGNINVEVIDNAGNILHILTFYKCAFKYADFSDFDYSKSDLRKVILNFSFEDVKTQTPDEAADKKKQDSRQ